MIIIFSNETDSSTDSVISWFKRFNIEFSRINHTANLPGFKTLIGSHEISEIIIGNRKNNITGVWFRKQPKIVYSKKGTSILNSDTTILAYIEAELKELFSGFYQTNVRMLGKPDFGSISKLKVLRSAHEFGFITPNTLITNQKEEIDSFINNYSKVIIKPLSNTPVFVKGNKAFSLYNEIISKSDIESLPKFIFPVLLQEYIEKETEIRVMYLHSKQFSATIFSQNNEQTSIDFRKYSKTKPNRIVPFILPQIITERIEKLMTNLGLNTGVIDLIYSPKGEFIFLEVNPAGQFGNISEHCNYFIEKKIAEYFLK